MTIRQKQGWTWAGAAVGLVTLIVTLTRAAMAASYASASDLKTIEGTVRVNESRITSLEASNARTASQIDDIHKFMFEGSR